MLSIAGRFVPHLDNISFAKLDIARQNALHKVFRPPDDVFCCKLLIWVTLPFANRMYGKGYTDPAIQEYFATL